MTPKIETEQEAEYNEFVALLAADPKLQELELVVRQVKDDFVAAYVDTANRMYTVLEENNMLGNLTKLHQIVDPLMFGAITEITSRVMEAVDPEGVEAMLKQVEITETSAGHTLH